jgi:hypothetical protein
MTAGLFDEPINLSKAQAGARTGPLGRKEGLERLPPRETEQSICQCGGAVDSLLCRVREAAQSRVGIREMPFQCFDTA